MALGTNKTQIRSLGYIQRNLSEHAELTAALMASGVPSSEASKIAYKAIMEPKAKGK